jgi:pimeloyl-ACP methyl ester carboxylesterase
MSSRARLPEEAAVDLDPRPEHKFTFGLWTVGHPGRDPFGDVTRPPLDPVEAVHRLADLGTWGVSLHDDDLVPPDATVSERSQIVKRFQAACEETGMVVSMCTTNLFWSPVFKEGAFTANDRDVRRYALAKAMRGIDLAAELGARIYVFWGGREGVEAYAAKSPLDAFDRYREAMNFLCGYVRDRGYDMRFALEPKPNEPRGDTFLPTVGHMLAFIERTGFPAERVTTLTADWNDAPSAYADDAMRKDAAALADHLGLDGFLCVGYSMGAGVTLRLLQHDDRVRAAVLGGIGGNTLRRRERGAIAEALVAENPSEVDDRIARSFREFADLTGADKQALAAIQHNPFPALEDLDGVGVPVLVLCGDNDPLAGSAQELAEAIPGARAAVMGGTHLNVINNREFHRELVGFLSEHGGDG